MSDQETIATPVAVETVAEVTEPVAESAKTEAVAESTKEKTIDWEQKYKKLVKEKENLAKAIAIEEKRFTEAHKRAEEYSSKYESLIAEHESHKRNSLFDKHGVEDAEQREFLSWKYSNLADDDKADFGEWLTEYTASRAQYAQKTEETKQGNVTPLPKKEPVKTGVAASNLPPTQRLDPNKPFKTLAEYKAARSQIFAKSKK